MTVPVHVARRLSPDEEIALAVAHDLIAAGVPVFAMRPALDASGQWDPQGGTGGTGYVLPPAWQKTVATPSWLDPSVLGFEDKAWRPGWGLAAVMGHGLDLLDVDPRNGGNETGKELTAERLWPKVYGAASTPSGGWHAFVASLGVGSRDDVRPGFDVKGGRPDGDGRGFAFLAPTVRASKTTGKVEPYRWERVPDLAGFRDGDTSGEALAEVIRQARQGTAAPLIPEPRSYPHNADDAADTADAAGIANPEEYVAQALEGMARELAETTKGGRDRALNAHAYRLGRFKAGGLPVDEEAVVAAFTDACAANGYSADPAHEPVARKVARSMANGARNPYVWTPTAPPTYPKPSPFVASGEGVGDVGGVVGDQVLIDNGWTPVELAAYLDGTHVPELPALLARQDGEHVMYPGRVHWLAGEPEALKSWLALLATAQQLLVGRRVVYVDLEDTASGVIERLRMIGVPDQVLAAHFVYLNPHGGLTAAERDALAPVVEGASLVVIDAATEALAIQGLDPNVGTDVASWLVLLPRWAASNGAAVLVLDHVVKNTENRGRFAIGSGHKLAGLDGVAMMIAPIVPGGRGMSGRSRLYVTKDRHGYVNPLTKRSKSGRWLGDLVVDNTAAPQYVEVVLFAPTEHEGPLLPTRLMAAVSAALEKAGEPLNKQRLEARVTGRSSSIREAVEALIDGGHVVIEDGPRGALLHRLAKPYPAPE